MAIHRWDRFQWIGSSKYSSHDTQSLHDALIQGWIFMTRRFAIGFTIGLLAFILINLFSAHISSDCGLLAVFERDTCADDIARAGWPFRFYERGGFDYRFEFKSPVLFFDLVIGTSAAGGLGWFFARKAR